MARRLGPKEVQKLIEKKKKRNEKQQQRKIEREAMIKQASEEWTREAEEFARGSERFGINEVKKKFMTQEQLDKCIEIDLKIEDLMELDRTEEIEQELDRLELEEDLLYDSVELPPGTHIPDQLEAYVARTSS